MTVRKFSAEVFFYWQSGKKGEKLCSVENCPRHFSWSKDFSISVCVHRGLAYVKSLIVKVSTYQQHSSIFTIKLARPWCKSLSVEPINNSHLQRISKAYFTAIFSKAYRYHKLSSCTLVRSKLSCQYEVILYCHSAQISNDTLIIEHRRSLFALLRINFSLRNVKVPKVIFNYR